MTINGSTNMTMNDSLGHKVDKRFKKVWDTKTGEHWDNAHICARELKVHVTSVYYACNGRTKTCKGRELSYDENVSETRERMANNLSAQNAEITELKAKKDAEIAKLKAEMEALKADAELGRKTRLEQEAARKAEEKRLKAIKKADNKVELRQRMYDRKMEEVKHAYARLMEAKEERKALGEAV